MLLFHNQHTLAAAREVQEALRARFPAASEVAAASVIDISRVPRLLRSVVEPTLKKAYVEATKYIPSDLNAADYIIILPDWTGETSRAFGVRNVDKEAAIVVIDAEGRVAGSHQGSGLGQAALDFVERC